MTEPVRLTLPIPPSTNNLYRGGPRYKTDEYKPWISEAGWSIKAQPHRRFLGKTRLAVAVRLPFNRRRDIDNLKAIGDLLKTMGLIDDDKWIDRWLIERAPVGEDLVVTISPLGEAMEESDGVVKRRAETGLPDGAASVGVHDGDPAPRRGRVGQRHTDGARPRIPLR
jgi:Holliday junction resolvase RusA-like endonuclease